MHSKPTEVKPQAPYIIRIDGFELGSSKAVLSVKIKAKSPLVSIVLAAQLLAKLKETPLDTQVYIMPEGSEVKP